ncbi:hypothetical protein QM806_33800 [Rhodococcus sp. IEGM 1351]|uniref:hypothetical protein n=1 Tax=Rhodococcus sp. IEGM 1351 TaxID=3047089 RepID=UPI0024B715B5|nr:hypothetical protein [Rhodococcus sp. IEGM 1351]MDI9940350.1 hypothetical protein [Rhodococcus sp. IEGM 1351]
MSGTEDFVVNGVITNSPDVARAELAQAPLTERKAHKVYDILAICEAADKFAEEVFTEGSVVRQVALLDCRYVARYVALLEALGYGALAADLQELHISEYYLNTGTTWRRVTGLPAHDGSATG